jgi:hypothetical protein
MAREQSYGRNRFKSCSFLNLTPSLDLSLNPNLNLNLNLKSSLNLNLSLNMNLNRSLNLSLNPCLEPECECKSESNLNLNAEPTQICTESSRSTNSYREISQHEFHVLRIHAVRSRSTNSTCHEFMP